MKKLACAILLLLGSGALWANPIILTEGEPQYAYISSEHLDVALTPDTAVFDGEFVFNSPGERGVYVTMDVPIWIPDLAVAGQTDLAAFLRKYPLNRGVQLEERNRVEFDRLLHASIAVGGKDIPIQGLILYQTRADQQAIPREGQRTGKLCAVVLLRWLLMPGKSSVRIRYAQPLVQKSAQVAEFFYLPKFAHMPSGFTTDNIDTYAMNITPQQGALNVEGQKVDAGKTQRLPLKHYQPIVAEMIRADRS